VLRSPSSPRAEGERVTLRLPPASGYADSQLDDTQGRARRLFRWRPPLRFSVRARTSIPDPRGTFGFGFWNDPFSLSLGMGGAARKLPAAPQCAWFFYGSPPHDLPLAEGVPGSGWKAQTLSFTRLHSGRPAGSTGLRNASSQSTRPRGTRTPSNGSHPKSDSLSMAGKRCVRRIRRILRSGSYCGSTTSMRSPRPKKDSASACSRSSGNKRSNWRIFGLNPPLPHDRILQYPGRLQTQPGIFFRRRIWILPAPDPGW
jgi:hypothetical protein